MTKELLKRLRRQCHWLWFQLGGETGEPIEQEMVNEEFAEVFKKLENNVKVLRVDLERQGWL